MIAKYNKKITEYKYILSFDIAKYVTGFSLIDIKNNKIVTVGTIDMKDVDSECFWNDYYIRFAAAIGACMSHVEDNEKCLITKEKLPSQAGRFSTVQTLQSLAQSHAIFDLLVCRSGIDVYDYDGIHSVSEKAYFRKIMGIEKPSKADIAKKISELFPDYNLSNVPLDITDSIAVTLTLLNVKYNNDIDQEIKKIKKEMKQYKSEKKIDELKEKLKFLLGLKI